MTVTSGLVIQIRVVGVRVRIEDGVVDVVVEGRMAGVVMEGKNALEEIVHTLHVHMSRVERRGEMIK